jgi:hypothetical protein
MEHHYNVSTVVLKLLATLVYKIISCQACYKNFVLFIFTISNTNVLFITGIQLYMSSVTYIKDCDVLECDTLMIW